MKDKFSLAAMCLVFAFATLVSAQNPPTYPAPNQYPSQATTTQNTGNALTLPAGTQIQIRTNEPINATQADVDRQYSAEIADNIVDANGNIVVPKGSPAELAVLKTGTSTMGVGSNEVSLGLKSINVGGRTYLVQTNPVQQQNNRGIGANKRTAEMTGGGAVLGTVIGAVAGGGKGAAIGAVVGGLGGATAQVLTRGKEVKVPAETMLTFKLDQPVQLM